MDRLFDHLDLLTRPRDRAEAAVALVTALQDLLDLDSASVHCLALPAGDILVGLVAAADRDGVRCHYDGPAWPDDMVSIECAPHLQASLNAHGPHRDSDGGRPRLTVPLFVQETEPAGFVVLTRADWLDDDDPLLAGLIAVFLNHRRLLEYAQVDTLTRLLNRKTFDEQVLRILARLGTAGDLESGALHLPHRRRPDFALEHHWLGVIDVDHFKRINDGYGHLIGDEVLILLANMMRASFRATDSLFRFGGEEFVILLNPAGEHDAQRVFERFRETVAGFAFPQVGRVTVSTGFARIGPHDTPAAIFDRADEALYWAKGHGRNRVCGYEQLVAAGAIAPQAAPSHDVELF